ncbi:hypothetical protein V5O48_012546 [Marasmius crinis-equi]|uniref:Uncharacterized protein n=1 Tax=Marasmius crinis-equi TaxID=585013 RepID=A0ABR3F2W1_9AGAR
MRNNSRFAWFRFLQDQHHFVPRLERGIPVVHATGHIQLVCRIIFAPFYRWCNGHFTGETAEQLWPEFNWAATYTCQMLEGHCHDVMTNHYNNNNHKKTTNQAYTLAWGLVIAASQLEDHMELLQQESAVHSDKVSQWSREVMVPCENPKAPGSWIDSYHRPERDINPSADSLLQSIVRQKGRGIELAIPDAGIDVEVYWRRAFEAEDIRERITILKGKGYLPAAEAKTLEDLQGRLSTILKQFRERQNVIMPCLPERFSEGRTDGIEGFTLGLPSDMTANEREKFGVASMAHQEGSLRRSHSYHTISALQSTCSKLKTLTLYKDHNVSTEKMRTHFGRSMQTVLDACTRLLSIYNHDRDALIALGVIGEDDMDQPQMTIEDTERKNINRKHRTGDSKRRDGVLWMVGPSSVKKLPNIPLGLGDVEALQPEHLTTATRTTQRLVWDALGQATRKSCKENKDPAAVSIPRSAKEAREAKNEKKFRKGDEGVLWSLGARKGLAQADQATINTFEETGHHISWCRQQAEVFRWMEEFEKKHAEFHWLIRYFQRMEKAWLSVADAPEDPINTVEKIDVIPEARAIKVNALGAYGLRQAGVWGDYARIAQAQFREVSYPPFHDTDTLLAPRVIQFREEQFAWMKELDIQRADLAYGASKGGMERSKPAEHKKGKGKRKQNKEAQ